MIKNNKLKIIFKNFQDDEIDIDYHLNDSVIAEKWFKKIKHLKNLSIDENESEIADLHNLKNIYQEFCKFAKIEPLSIKIVDQKLLNDLHKVYEEQHDILSKKRDNSILYKFHHSIHYNESSTLLTKKINVGWGVKEGPLTENFNCNNYYEANIIKNNLYLPWAELGKKPLAYWENKEPNDQKRFNQLAKPHLTFRAKFFVAVEDTVPTNLNIDFINWFNNYKNSWFEHYNIGKWNHIDEYSAPLLAITNYKESLVNCKFIRIEL